MTNLDVMLKWYAPDTVTTLYCDECGREMQSVDGRNHKILCPECNKARRSDRANVKNRATDDPCADLVFAVIKQAIHDKEWQWHAPKLADNEDLKLAECDPADFLRDGAHLWLEALGLTLRPSMRARLAEMGEND